MGKGSGSTRTPTSTHLQPTHQTSIHPDPRSHRILETILPDVRQFLRLSIDSQLLGGEAPLESASDLLQRESRSAQAISAGPQVGPLPRTLQWRAGATSTALYSTEVSRAQLRRDEPLTAAALTSRLLVAATVNAEPGHATCYRGPFIYALHRFWSRLPIRARAMAMGLVAKK